MIRNVKLVQTKPPTVPWQGHHGPDGAPTQQGEAALGGGLPISRGLGQATGGWEESVEKRVSLNSDMSMSVSSSVSSSMGTGVFQPSRCLCQ